MVVCSFIYGGSKPKTKEGTSGSSEPQSSDKLASPASAPPTAIWPADADVKSEQPQPQPHTGIDLTRGWTDIAVLYIAHCKWTEFVMLTCSL